MSQNLTGLLNSEQLCYNEDNALILINDFMHGDDLSILINDAINDDVSITQPHPENNNKFQRQ